jgi:hypothetical protein
MKTNLWQALLAGLLFCMDPISAWASAIYDFDSAPISFGDSRVTVGFEFTANTDLMVNALGFYDHNQDGLEDSHKVGIFDTNGELLTSVKLSNGTNETLDGKFRYKAIDSITLTAGQSYIIAGLATGDDGYTYGNFGTTIQGLTISPDITVDPLASLYQYGSSLKFPTQHFRYDLYPMVNFKYAAVSSVPLPAAFPLLGAGLAGLAGMQRRFSKKQLG